MRRPDLNMIEPGRGHGAGSGEAAIQEELNKAKSAPHGPAIDRAAMMLDFARCPRTQFHASYFATMAVKLLQPLLGDAAESRARSLRLQSVGEPGRGGAWS